MSENPARPADGLTAEKQALLALRKMRARIEELERARTEPIAIVGAGCRLPGGATTPEEFWRLLHDGIDAVSEVPPDRWDADAFYDPDPDAPGKMYTRRGGFLAGVDAFDPRHFGITPREATSMDPQQRLLLEVTWEALERAGHAPDRLAGSDTGVFVGISTNDYGQILLRAADQIDPGMYFGTGNLLNAAAGRLSYVLGLQGPSMAVDTACSSSLVAVHLACQSLRNRECRTALAGGVNLVLVPEVTVNCCRAKMLAPDGRCKTFDAAADGYVRGEGCAVVVLKRLSDAVADGDRILALVRGSAVNQDGRSGGFTAPNELAQQAVIRAALAAGGVAPADVQYVEAHGTGTALGDPIEIHAIAAALREGRTAEQPLKVGSVKTNVGHLEAAAGITGLMKVALALQHEEIPPHLHFRELNPHIELGEFPLDIPRSATRWPRGERPRLAGVSSFGFTGTNAHVIVEEAPAPAARVSAADRPLHVLALSARTDDALREMAGQYAAHLASAEVPLGDVCFTAAQARAVFDHRLAVVAGTGLEAAAQLAGAAAGSAARLQAAKVRTRDEGVVFLFTGQGSQYAGMGRELYETQPVFRTAIDRCDEILRGTLERPLLSVIYPRDGERSPIDDTAYTQPALFAVGFALAQVWRSWGVEPSAVLGHSIGEYTAACIAGALSLEDALRLVAARGRLMQQLPAGGAMAAVTGSEAHVREALARSGGRVTIAALNGPANTVIAGDAEAVNAVVEVLSTQGVVAQRLTVSHAFHSPLMDPMLDEFERAVAAVPAAALNVPFVSNVTGGFLPRDTVLGGTYWRRHAREAVRFADGIAALHARGDRVFLEIGPSPTLSAMARRIVDAEDVAWLTSLRKGRSDWKAMLDAVAGLFVRGVAIDWAGFDRPYHRRKADLPTYPFQRERYWVRTNPAKSAAASPEGAAQAVEPYALHAIRWVPQDAPATGRGAGTLDGSGHYLIVGDESAFTTALASELERAGQSCSRILPEDAARCGDAIAASGVRCGGVLLLAGFGKGADLQDDDEHLVRGERACGALASIVRAVSGTTGSAARVFVVTAGAQPAGAVAPLAIAAAPLWGLGRVIALEHPASWGGLIDVPRSATANDAVHVVREVLSRGGDDQVAIRDGARYVARLDRLASLPATRLSVSAGATYVVTGGFGSLGLAVAGRLVSLGARSIALVGRRGLPPRADWSAIDPASETGRQIAAVSALERAGAAVRVCSADVSNRAAVDRLFSTLAASAPPVRGVVHAAGISSSAAVADLTADTLAPTFEPKLAGAWRLHEATRGLPLDFFVLFSSVSAVWGSRGLAAYAAANHYLDALAHHRRALGLPATSINWGPWAGGGMMNEEGQKWLAALGVRALDPDPALDALERAIGSGEPQAVIADVSWDAFLPVYEGRGARPFMDRVRPASAARQRPPQDREFVERLSRLLPFDRREAIARAVLEHVAEVVGSARPAGIDRDEGLFDLGMDSLMATELRRRLEKQFDRTLPPTLTFDYPTVNALAGCIDAACFSAEAAPIPAEHNAADPEGDRDDAVAIIGIGCRFPGGADTPERFWHILRTGQHVVSEIPADRWDTQRYFDVDPEAPGKTSARHGGFIEQVDRFDPGFFGISPREAASMDPQHRLLLEVAWEALERAGQNPAALSGTKTGVFVGITTTDYAQVVGAAGPQYADGYLMTGTALNFAAGRLSYVLGLQGPCLAVDTACSSSLTAIHLACRSLRAGDCDLALAGGVNLILRPDGMVVASKAGMLSTSGVCRTFDASADGIVRAEGCGVLVLKPLAAAVGAGDPILAVVRGSAMNQDGRSSGITVPNGLAQEALIRDALRDAGLQPRDLSYVEAHGTGTRIGDPIEVRALGAVLAEGRPADDPLLLGSVKTNIGHAESAAGVAGAIKVALALQHREIPPHLHLERLNPDISLERANAVVPTRVTPLAAARPIAGVSSFGASGTNVHVILEAAPEIGVRDGGDRDDRPLHLLTLSARSESALAELEGRYQAFLAERQPAVADLCFTASTGRAHLPHRRAFLADSAEGLRVALNGSADRDRRSVAGGVVAHGGRPKIAFLFTGQGSQYVGMGRQLYQTQPVFRAVLDRCDAALRSELPVPLLSVLYGDAPSSPLGDTQYTQPALFAVQCALAELWRTWGVEPSAVLGHSVGEYAAACVAGRLSLDDGLRLIAARGRLMQALPRAGAMAAVFAAPPAVQAAVDARAGLLSIAALNGPENTVISGDADALRSALDELSRSGIKAQRLDVSHAFHSALIEPMLDEFERAAANVSYGQGRLGFVSNLTGTVADPAFELTARYWREHARQPVRFAEGMSALLEQGYTHFVEIGPHPTLTALGRRIADAHDAVWTASLRRGTPDWRQMLETLAQLYVSGVPVDWHGFDKPYERRKLVLPTYPFQRQRHWVTPAEDRPAGSSIHTVAWRERPLQGHLGAAHGTWVVFGGDDVAAALARRLDAEGAQTIVPPPEIVQTEGGVERWWLEHAAAIPVHGVAYVCGHEESTGASAELLAAQRRICGGLLDLVRAMAKRAVNPPRLWVITRGSQGVLGGEASAAHAAAWGLGGTIANEHSEWRPVRIDLDPAGAHDLELLSRELLGDAPDDRVAFRRGGRYVARLVRGGNGSAPATTIHPEASYLITGGCGALGLAVARWLVARGAKNVALVARRAPSPAAQTAIDALASTGARVIACQADITKPGEAARLLQEVESGLAPVRGLVHAAGVLDDGVLVQQTWERFERVLAPKVLGAANLHEATRNRPLDFFVLFSSMSALLGAPGQGNYTAANAWLDAFASECRRSGQPAISINWGPWADGGMASDLARSHQQRWAARGVRLLSADAGTRALHTLLDSGLAHAAIFDVDWEAFLAGTGETPPFLDELHTRRPVAAQRHAAKAVELLTADGSVRPAVAEAFCREVVAASLGVPPASVDVQCPIRELGFDSLMALEARNRIQRTVSVSVPVVRLLDGSTVRELAAHVAEEAQRAQRGSGPGTPRELSPDEAAELLARLPELSDAEVDTLLDRLQQYA